MFLPGGMTVGRSEYLMLTAASRWIWVDLRIHLGVGLLPAWLN